MAQEKWLSAKRYEPDNLVKIAEKHIERYQKLIDIGMDENHPRAENVRLVECEDLLKLWKSIEGKAGIWELLTDAEQGEVNDALFDQDPEDSENDA